MSIGFRKGFADVVAAIRGTLADGANAGSLSAVDFAKLSGIPAGVNALAVAISAEIDLAATSSGTIVAPAVLGKVWFPERIGIVNTVATGAFSTAATIRIGNNSPPTNLFAAGTGLSNSTAFAVGVGGCTTSAVLQSTQLQNAANVVDVTIAATGTGGFSWKAKILLFGYYV
jgi:hypothetical protein